MGLFSKKNSPESSGKLTVLFVTDLHGSEHVFRKLLGALGIWKPQVLVIGGDAAGKGLFPILKDGDGFRLRWMEKDFRIEAEELPNYEGKALQMGFYPYRLDADELQAMRSDPAMAEAVFERQMVERWTDWLDRLDRKCGELQIPAFVIAGNDDPWVMDEPFATERQWVTGGDGKVLPFMGSFKILSTGMANPTPWDCPRDVPEEELEEHLRALAAQVDDFDALIANIHVPPYGSTLDTATVLDTSVYPPRPIVGQTTPVGSHAVATFINEFQPLLALVGHIHESPGAVKMGRTTVINPGSEYAENVIRGVLVTVQPGKVIGHQFVNG